VGIGIHKTNAGIGIPVPDFSVRCRTKKMLDCVALHRYRIRCSIVSCFQSGTRLTGCRTIRHSGFQNFILNLRKTSENPKILRNISKFCCVKIRHRMHDFCIPKSNIQYLGEFEAEIQKDFSSWIRAQWGIVWWKKKKFENLVTSVVDPKQFFSDPDAIFCRVLDRDPDPTWLVKSFRSRFGSGPKHSLFHDANNLIVFYSNCQNTAMPAKCQSNIVSFTVSPAASVRHRHSGIYLSPVPLITDYSSSAQLW
jgi:hypothetical protein